MTWRDERDDERAIDRWRHRMSERQHRAQTLERIRKAARASSGIARLAVFATVLAFGYALCSVALQQCATG